MGDTFEADARAALSASKAVTDEYQQQSRQRFGPRTGPGVEGDVLAGQPTGEADAR